MYVYAQGIGYRIMKLVNGKECDSSGKKEKMGLRLVPSIFLRLVPVKP
jgi:hypothetical protein